MSSPSHKKPVSQGWQLLAALVAAVLLVMLKTLDVGTAFGYVGHLAGLTGVLTALVATCLLIRWVGAAAPALLFMTVFLVVAGYVPLEVATQCLKDQLADPFVVIVFSGFALLALMFGMPSERVAPPAWALRPGELVGRDGEWLRSRMGRFCLRFLADPLWARLGALLPGFVITLISSGLGADAMSRMAAIPKKSSDESTQQAGSKSSEEEQNARASVFVLIACVLAPALIPVSLWGMFFSIQAGTFFGNAGTSPWLAASYPCLMAILLPVWLWWPTRSKRQPILAYYAVYALAWGVIVALAFALQHRTREQFAVGLLTITVVYSSLRVFRRSWQALRVSTSTNRGIYLRPLNWWVSKIEWELIKGGFSRALGVVVIVVFAAIFRKVIEAAVPASVEFTWVAQFPITAVVACVLAVLTIGLSIGTAFGTFVLGLALVRIMWPNGMPLPGEGPIMFWLLVSISAAINQISLQADNVEVMEKYEDRGRLTFQVSDVVLPTLAGSIILSLVGWAYLSRSIFSWRDLTAGLVLVCCGVVAFRLRQKPVRAGDQSYEKRRLLWLGVLGESARALVGRARIAGDFITNYDADNDTSNVKPESAIALLRTVPLEGEAAWSLAEGRIKPDALLLLVGLEASTDDLLRSPLVTRYLRDGSPKVRVLRLLPDGDNGQPEQSDIWKRISGGGIKDCIGQDGLRTLAHNIVSCLDHQEGCGAKPEMYDWLFSSGK